MKKKYVTFHINHILQVEVLAVVLFGENDYVRFIDSILFIGKQHDILERTFNDYNRAFYKMNQLFAKPNRSINANGTMKREFLEYFSQESMRRRGNLVRGCRCQAQRVIEAATKLYINSEAFICVNHYFEYQGMLFLTQEENDKMQQYYTYSRNLIYSAYEILNKYVLNQKYYN